MNWNLTHLLVTTHVMNLLLLLLLLCSFCLYCTVSIAALYTGGGTCAAGIVSGKVIHVNRSNPTIGPVYTVEWQDGLRETGLNTKAMLELLEPTPRSLGHGTPATPEVLVVVDSASELSCVYLYARKCLIQTFVQFLLFIVW